VQWAYVRKDDISVSREVDEFGIHLQYLSSFHAAVQQVHMPISLMHGCRLSGSSHGPEENLKLKCRQVDAGSLCL
jgi:hypothetical protein